MVSKMSNTYETLTRLMRVCEGATQGEWEYTGSNSVDYECAECGAEFPESGYAVKSKDQYQTLECHLYGMERFAKPDGEFIATFNPSTMKLILGALDWALDGVRDSECKCRYEYTSSGMHLGKPTPPMKTDKVITQCFRCKTLASVDELLKGIK